jgi:rsbT co-antagonist protein RsbR
MIQRLRNWLEAIPLDDPIERRQANAFQLVLIAWIALSVVWMFVTALLFTQPPPASAEPIPPVIVISIALLFFSFTFWWFSPVVALALLRRGRFKVAVLVATLGMLIAHSIGTFVLGTGNGSVLVVYQLPIALAGLLAGRRLLLTATGTSIAVIVGVSILQSQSPPLAGFFSFVPDASGNVSAAPNSAVWGNVVFFLVITLVVTLLLDRFGGTFRTALINSLEREADLERTRASLEGIVAERTVLLQTALDEVQARASEQAELLARIDEQFAVIRDLSVPVIPISADTLVMPLVGALDSARLQQLREQSLQALERTAAHILILDITGVPLVDSQVAQGLIQTVRAGRLLGAEVALVGIRPEVAQTIVGLGIQFGDMHTYSDLQSALAHISARRARAASQPSTNNSTR